MLLPALPARLWAKGPLGRRQMLAQRPFVGCFHVNGAHAPQGHSSASLTNRSTSHASRPTGNTTSFEWRGREQVVSERIRHAEQLQRQRWIVRSKLSVKHVGIYLRVSTNGQTTENQRRELETVAARSGW